MVFPIFSGRQDRAAPIGPRPATVSALSDSSPANSSAANSSAANSSSDYAPTVSPQARVIPETPQATSMRNVSCDAGRAVLLSAVASGTAFLAQASGVFRTLTGLGLIVADAVSEATVGYAEQSTLSLQTRITNDLGEELCSDDYLTDLPLEPRDGIPIADWKPLVFLGGIVLAETLRMASAWVSKQSSEYQHNRLIGDLVEGGAQISDTDLEARAVESNSAGSSDTIECEGATTSNSSLQWMKRLRQFSQLLSQGGSAAMGVAMSAELFRSGIPLMPYFGLNDLQVAEASTQLLEVSHSYECPDSRFDFYATPGGQYNVTPCGQVNGTTGEQFNISQCEQYNVTSGGEYNISAELTLPGVSTSNISAEALIGLLFNAGVGAQALGHVMDQCVAHFQHKAIVAKFAEPLAQHRQTKSPKALSQWLAKELRTTGYVQEIEIPGLVKKLTNVFSDESNDKSRKAKALSNLPAIQMRDFRDVREASLRLIDRLANTALIASYAARVMTTGVPFISNGFNNLEAGVPTSVPINLEKPAFWDGDIRGNLNIDGEAIIPGSRLEHITTDLFAPLILSAGATKVATTLLRAILDQGGISHASALVKAKPLKTTAYFAAQLLLRGGQQATAAFGAFGLSLFLGARIAADLVNGSRIESSSNLEGTFDFNASILANSEVVGTEQLERSNFSQITETIELPNPSQITGMTMLAGGLGGSALLLLSQGLVLLQRKLETYAPQLPAQPQGPAIAHAAPSQEV